MLACCPGSSVVQCSRCDTAGPSRRGTPATACKGIRRFQEISGAIPGGAGPPEVCMRTAVMSTAPLLSSTVSVAAAGEEGGAGEAQAGRHFPQSVVPGAGDVIKMSFFCR